MAKPNGDSMNAARRSAFQQLNISPDHRAILCLDGGGMRGILTIGLLKKLEEVAGIPCHALFDMVAGTSTGGIIAGLIAAGHTATAIESLYEDLVSDVFDHRFLGNRFINPPAFSKEEYRSLLLEVLQDVSLQQVCGAQDIDLMITVQDLSAAEETFFSCFQQTDGQHYGTYKDVLLRSVMEATMSAPTYFYPLERFVDGGTTTYNNPSLAAFMEAVSYSTPDKNEKSSTYKMSQITLFSFGTGISRQFIQPGDTLDPDGLDIKFWLNWLLSEMGQDASAMQVDTFRSPMIKDRIDFRRFQISLDQEAIRKIPNTDGLDISKYQTRWLHDLDDKLLRNIDMADITRFDLMKIIGQQMAAYIMQPENGAFTKDLARNGRDKLVTVMGDIARIQKQMKDPDWIDGFQA